MKPETVQLLKNLGIGVGLITLVTAMMWGAWHLVRLPALQITDVVVTGGETISHDAITAEVETVLTGAYWGEFVPRQFMFTYPRTEILSTLEATPRVKEPTLTRDGQTLVVELAEFEPVALWCDAMTASTSPCVFLDENGYGFAAAPVLAGGAYTRFARNDRTATTSAVYADTTDFALLRELEALLVDYGWSVARIELDQARDAFVYLVGGGELKVTLRQTPVETVDNLRTVLAAEQYRHLRPDNFVYIDLRFGNKVFVSEFGVPEVEIDADLDTATTTIATPDEA